MVVVVDVELLRNSARFFSPAQTIACVATLRKKLQIKHTFSTEILTPGQPVLSLTV